METKKIACDHCNKTFKKRRGLHLHLTTIHRGQITLNHKCDQCDLAYRTPLGLNKHRLSRHSNNNDNNNNSNKNSNFKRKLMCTKCNDTFDNRSLLVTHMRSEHPEVMKGDRGLGLSKDYSVSINDDKNNNNNNSSNKKKRKPYRKSFVLVCTRCNETFGTRSLLAKHKWIEHSEVMRGNKNNKNNNNSSVPDENNGSFIEDEPSANRNDDKQEQERSSLSKSSGCALKKRKFFRSVEFSRDNSTNINHENDSEIENDVYSFSDELTLPGICTSADDRAKRARNDALNHPTSKDDIELREDDRNQAELEAEFDAEAAELLNQLGGFSDQDNYMDSESGNGFTNYLNDISEMEDSLYSIDADNHTKHISSVGEANITSAHFDHNSNKGNEYQILSGMRYGSSHIALPGMNVIALPTLVSNPLLISTGRIARRKKRLLAECEAYRARPTNVNGSTSKDNSVDDGTQEQQIRTCDIITESNVDPTCLKLEGKSRMSHEALTVIDDVIDDDVESNDGVDSIDDANNTANDDTSDDAEANYNEDGNSNGDGNANDNVDAENTDDADAIHPRHAHSFNVTPTETLKPENLIAIQENGKGQSYEEQDIINIDDEDDDEAVNPTISPPRADSATDCDQDLEANPDESLGTAQLELKHNSSRGPSVVALHEAPPSFGDDETDSPLIASPRIDPVTDRDPIASNGTNPPIVQCEAPPSIDADADPALLPEVAIKEEIPSRIEVVNDLDDLAEFHVSQRKKVLKHMTAIRRRLDKIVLERKQVDLNKEMIRLMLRNQDYEIKGKDDLERMTKDQLMHESGLKREERRLKLEIRLQRLELDAVNKKIREIKSVTRGHDLDALDEGGEEVEVVQIDG